MITATAAPPGLLLLADSRLPTGGHAHSCGIEEAVRRGDVRGGVHGAADVAAFLAARIPTAGLVTASFCAAACVLASGPGTWAPWEAALDARTPVATLRDVSRVQGRAMLRTVRAVWPDAPVEGLGARPHQALVLGVATAAAGGDAGHASALAVHHLAGQTTSAAVRLLGLDPLALAGVLACALEAAAPTIAQAARHGTEAAAAGDPGLLPAATTPRPEVLAVLHARAEGALFAS